MKKLVMLSGLVVSFSIEAMKNDDLSSSERLISLSEGDAWEVVAGKDVTDQSPVNSTAVEVGDSFNSSCEKTIEQDVGVQCSRLYSDDIQALTHAAELQNATGASEKTMHIVPKDVEDYLSSGIGIQCSRLHPDDIQALAQAARLEHTTGKSMHIVSTDENFSEDFMYPWATTLRHRAATSRNKFSAAAFYVAMVYAGLVETFTFPCRRIRPRDEVVRNQTEANRLVCKNK